MHQEHPDMTDLTQESETQYIVVVNQEEQYSIWRADREPPAGWQLVTGPDSKSECLAYIERVWTDMRPRSLRLQMSSPSN
jgi:uncharacterized protein YbdZ (MbtH family)